MSKDGVIFLSSLSQIYSYLTKTTF